MARFQKLQKNKYKKYLTSYICLALILGTGIYFYSSTQVFGEKRPGLAENNLTNLANIANKNIVCLDPGHGGEEDPGAQNGDVVERDINLDVAQKIKSILESKNIKVYLTRENSEAVGENKDRAVFCNDKNADILVSIHHNDYIDSSTDYATALYYKDNDIELANYLLNTVSADLNVTNNGLESFEDNVLIKSDMPAVLLEPFFVSNNYERSQIEYGNRLDQEAKSIASGIESYLAK